MKIKFIEIVIMFFGFVTGLIAQDSTYSAVVGVPPSTDTLHYVKKSPFRIDAVYSFSGTVSTTRKTNDNVPAQLTLINTITGLTYSTSTTSASAAFTFTNIPEGKYILKGFSINEPYNFYTSYYFKKTDQASANVIDVTGNITGVNFFLVYNGGMVTAENALFEKVTSIVFPTVFENEIVIEATNYDDFEVYDLKGQIFFNSLGVYKGNINTQSWLPGVYFFKTSLGRVFKSVKI